MRIPLRTLFPLLLVACLITGPALAQGSVTVSANPAEAIPDDGYIGTLDGNDGTGTDAGMVCADLDFSGEPASTVLSVAMEIGITHTWLGDLTVKVKSPDGSVLPVMVRPLGDGATNPSTDDGEECCGDSSELDAAFPLLFGDGYANDPEAMGSTIGTSEAVCRDDATCEFLPNRDVATTGTIESFADFSGETANGVWEVCAGDGAGGDTGTFETVSLTVQGSAFPTASEGPAEGLPDTYLASQAYPNPFASRTSFDLTVAKTQDVTVAVYNVLGQRVATLFEGAMQANALRTFVFDAATLPAGAYLVRMDGETFSDTRRVTLLH